MDGQAIPSSQDNTTPAPVPNETNTVDIIPEVVNKISEAHNILVALSSDPSVDEMAAAIGLSLFLDKLGKRATAIYSGATPNALEFLKPEETFESTADTLQDFVIALNKEKADHLRYKLDGDFVKIFITPYRTRISEEDLEFTYGDFNVDLVLALDVANGIDLDSALREHGRIMHDAVIVNITTGNPGKFGEIEWSDKKASSVSEMIAKLLYSINSKAKIEKEEATAFLTGIVAATNRFSGANTTADTMKISSRLMESGANQQLIAKNITPDTENEMFSMLGTASSKKNQDATALDIKHGNEEVVDEDKEVDTTVTEKESTLLDDLKAAEASLSQAGSEATPEATSEPLKIESSETTPESTNEPTTPSSEPSVPAESVESPELPEVSETPTAPETPAPVESEAEPEAVEAAEPGSASSSFVSDKPEKVLQPSSELLSGPLDAPSKYGQMLEEALASVSPAPVAEPTPQPSEVLSSMAPATAEMPTNPAAVNAPAVPAAPEINGVPEINYMPMPGDEVLPPPPTPPIMPDVETPAPVVPTPEVPVSPAAPAVTPEPVSAPTPTASVQAPAASDPSAFKIPGM